MYYILESGVNIDIMYHIFSDGSGAIAAYPHTDRHFLPHVSAPPDTKVYRMVNDRIGYEVWPHDEKIRFRTEFRRLRGRWPSTLGKLVAKSESQPDFIFE